MILLVLVFGMTPEQVVKHFGGVAAAARALEYSRQHIYKWRTSKRIPRKTQKWIEAQTYGALRAEK